MFLESKLKAAPSFEFILKKLENNDEDNEVVSNVRKKSEDPYGEEMLLKEFNNCGEKINIMINNEETQNPEFENLVNIYESNRRLLGIPDDKDYRKFIVNEK